MPSVDPANLPEIMTPAVYGSVVSKSTSQLAYDRYMGRGPAYVHYGRRVFYLRADVIAFLEDNRVIPAQKQKR
jgi:hypothetical protein